MKFKTNQLVIFLFLVFSVTDSLADTFGSPLVRNITRKDYKAGTQNWSIGMDQRGLMYFGNNKGLLEYDGTYWNTYELPNSTIVRSFAFANDSKIYLGGQNEIGFIKPNSDGKFFYESLLNLVPEYAKAFDDIWKIFVLGDDVYFCSKKFIFIYADNKIKVIRPSDFRFENFLALKDKILVQDLDKGLYELINKELQFIEDSDFLIGNRVVAILPLAQYDLIITRKGQIYSIDKSGFSEWHSEASEFLLQNKPYCATKLADQKIAIGTSQNGMIIIDTDGKVSSIHNKNNGLQNNTVLSIFEDYHQNLWLGLDNGIDYLEINSSFSLVGPQMGIEGTGYAALLFNKKLYLGTNLGLYSLDLEKEGYGIGNNYFKSNNDVIGQIWSLDNIDGAMIISKHEGAFVQQKEKIDKLSDVQGAWKFCELKNHPGFAIEGTYNGFIIYKKDVQSKTNINWKIHSRLKGFDESARIFEEDERGDIWISHAYKGLFRLSLSDDLKSIKEIEEYGEKNGLPVSLYINVVRLRNEIIFTTPQGIYEFDFGTNSFSEHKDFTSVFGAGRNVKRMIEDDLGNIWFSIDKDFGVLKVEEKGVFNEYEILYFNQIHDDLVDGFEEIYALDSRNIFIGTENGFIHYDPKKTSITDMNFRVMIRKITSITGADSVIYSGNAAISNIVELKKFHYKLNDFRFDFSAPFYDKIEHLEYRYKLEGFESEWNSWSSKTEKEYTNLKEGNYTFNVQARNAYGQISTVDSYSFRIMPPWFLNIYTKLAYSVLFLMLITLVIRFIYNRERKKRILLKEEQNERLRIKEDEFKKEVERSENEIIRLRNDNLSTDISHKNSQLASATMHLVQKSEILIKLKSDLSNLVKEAPSEFRRKITQISRTIDEDIQLDNNWEQFEVYFDQVHENFFKRLRQNFPELTPKDQKLCAYLRMNLSTKEIAPLLNISVRGVEISRYRLRKKMNLDSNENLVAHIMDV